MANTQQHPLHIATRRLAGALDRLESNLQHITVGQDRDVHQEQQLTAFERENTALKLEHEQLNAALAKLKVQYDDLHKVASGIHGKLDDSIKRLTQIIEE